jgi:hypothetical protein
MPDLSVSQQARLRQMIADRRHPDVIDSFLASHGFSEAEIGQFYTETKLRRSHLLDCYRMKRNVRLVGEAILCGAIGIAVFGGSWLLSVGLIVYAIAIIATGSLMVYRP